MISFNVHSLSAFCNTLLRNKRIHRTTGTWFGTSGWGNTHIRLDSLLTICSNRFEKKILTRHIVVLLWSAILPTCFPPFMYDLIAPSPIFDRSISLSHTVHNVFRLSDLNGYNQFLYCSFVSH